MTTSSRCSSNGNPCRYCAHGCNQALCAPHRMWRLLMRVQFRRVRFFPATEVCARRRSGVCTMTAHVPAQMSLRQASRRGAGPRPVVADCCTCLTPRRGRAAAQAQPQAAHLSWSHAAVRVPCRTACRLACSQRSRSRAPNIWAARHAWTPACPLLCAVRRLLCLCAPRAPPRAPWPACSGEGRCTLAAGLAAWPAGRRASAR